MITILIISFVICFAYAAWAKLRYSSIACVSETYYRLSPRGWIFSVWSIATAVSLLPVWLEVTPPGYQFIAFLSVIAMGILGLAPRYLGDQALTHYICTGISAALAGLWCCLIGVWWLPLSTLVPIAVWVILKKRRDYLYWLEVALLLALYIAVTIKLL